MAHWICINREHINLDEVTSVLEIGDANSPGFEIRHSGRLFTTVQARPPPTGKRLTLGGNKVDVPPAAEDPSLIEDRRLVNEIKLWLLAKYAQPVMKAPAKPR